VLLSGLIAAMPKPALGALALVAALSMIKPQKFRAIGQVRRLELVWALVAFAGVILFGTLQGILIAVVLSILTLIYKANHPAVYSVAYNPERRVFSRVGDDPEAIEFPGLLILRTEGSLTFANAARTREKLHDLVVKAKPQVVVLECSAIPDIEYTALTMLTEAEASQRKRGVTLWLSGVNADLRKVLDRTPLGAALGPTRIYPNLFEALAAWQAGSLQLIDKAGS
jgi:SulP family sulfate permease